MDSATEVSPAALPPETTAVERPEVEQDAWSLRGLILLGILTWVVGRGLSQTLPGAFVGADRMVSAVLYAGAFFSQFLAIVGGTLALRLASTLLAEPTLAAWLRVLCLVETTCVVFGVLFSAQPRDPAPSPELLFVLACLGCSLLIFSGIRALREPVRRGPGLILLAAASSASCYTAARVIGWFASEQANTSLFRTSRIVATLGLGSGWVAVTLALLWLLRGQGLGPRIVAFLFLAIAPALTLKSAQVGPGALLTQTLERLSSGPEPLVPVGMTAAFEWLCLGSAFGALFTRTGSATVSAAIALAMLGLTTADTPLGTLVCALSAVLLLTSIPNAAR